MVSSLWFSRRGDARRRQRPAKRSSAPRGGDAPPQGDRRIFNEQRQQVDLVAQSGGENELRWHPCAAGGLKNAVRERRLARDRARESLGLGREVVRDR